MRSQPPSRGRSKQPAKRPRQPAASSARRPVERRDSAARRFQPLLAAGVMAMATVVVFWQATRCEFLNFDDNMYVTDNAQVRQGLSLRTVAWAFTSQEASNWHPLTWLSHLLDSSMWGVAPSAAFGHHLTNVLLHGLNAALLLIVGLSLTGHFWRSMWLAAFFAWHPLRVESVAWLSERKDVLSGLFWLLAIWAYIYYARNTSSWLRYALVVACFAAGLMAKPMVITLPMVFLLLDFWPLGRMQWQRWRPEWSTLVPLLREKLPLFCLIAVSAWVTYAAQLASGAVVVDRLPLWLRLINAVQSYAVYLRQTIWPVGLSAFYPYDQGPVSWWRLALALVVVGGVSVAAWRGRQRLPDLTVGWFWFLGTLVPVIGLVQVGGQAHADRYTYLPSMGLGIALVGTLSAVAGRVPILRLPVITAAVAGLAACIFVTQSQLQHWRSSELLFTRAVVVSPGSALAWTNLGAAQLAQRRTVDAVASYQRAVELVPAKDTRAGLATALAADGQVAAAIKIFDQLEADYPEDSKLANNLAWILATDADPANRRPDDAVRLAERANRLTAGADPMILDTLAAAYASAARFDEAVVAADRCIALAMQRRAPEFAQSVERRRALYLTGRPYVEAR